MITNYFSLYFNTDKVPLFKACEMVMDREIERRMFKQEIDNHVKTFKTNE